MIYQLVFFSEILNRTVTKIETQFKTFEYEQLKLSSAIASLEVANMNLSRLNCGKRSLHFIYQMTMYILNACVVKNHT